MTVEPVDARDLILVVDDDPDIARFVEMTLRFEGFGVVVAHDGPTARAIIERHRPDLVVLDVMMPRIDGLELTRQLRADPLTAALPIILLTAKGLSADKVVGLTAGADDYLVKPFDTLELLARVRATLRRNREIREVSPLTGLPGNTRILGEIEDRVVRAAAGGPPFVVCYVDMDHFKGVNDAYGFVRGDEFIQLVARVLHRATAVVGAPHPFLGHVGGDDFGVVCEPDQVQPLTDDAVASFEAAVRLLYDPADVARGYIELVDRQGVSRRSGFVTLSVGVALSSHRTYTDPRQIVAVATEMKSVAKRRSGSFVAVDRRRAG